MDLFNKKKVKKLEAQIELLKENQQLKENIKVLEKEKFNR